MRENLSLRMKLKKEKFTVNSLRLDAIVYAWSLGFQGFLGGEKTASKKSEKVILIQENLIVDLTYQ